MRRVGLAFWLLRAVFPAIVTYWSVRSIRALRLRLDGLGGQRRGDDPMTSLIKALGWSNAVSTLLLLLIILEILRILVR